MDATGQVPKPGTAWVRPANLTEAISLLLEADGAGRVVAGCTAMPPFTMQTDPDVRLAVDVMAIEDMARIESDGAFLRIGATVSIEKLAGDPDIAAQAPLLAGAARGIGDQVIRSMATVGGNVAARLPGAFELPVVLAALGAELEVITPHGARTLPMEVLDGPNDRLGPFDVVASITLASDRHAGWVYRKLTTNFHSYGIASLAVNVPAAGPPRAYASLGSATPQRLAAVETALSSGKRFDAATVAADACQALGARSDALASAAYRRRALRNVLEAELGRMLDHRAEVPAP